MPAIGIVMRPVNDRRSPRIVNHFSAHFDAVARLHGNPWSNGDIVNDFDATGCCLHIERFVLALRPSPQEKMRRGGNAPVECNFGRVRSKVSGLQVHALRSRALAMPLVRFVVP